MMFQTYITGGDGQTRNWRKVKRLVKTRLLRDRNRNYMRDLYRGKPWLREHYNWFH